MKKLLNILCILLIAVTLNFALYQAYSKASFDAEGAINGMNQKELKEIFEDSDSNKYKSFAGFEGINVKGNNMPLTQAEGEGAINREKGSRNIPVICNKDNCELGAIFRGEETLKREEKMDEYGFNRNPDMMPNNNHGYLDKVLAQGKNPQNEFDYLKGSYKNCTPTEEIINTTNSDTCDEYHSSKVSTCFPEQIVEIDSKYSYLCNKTRESKIKTCRDEITSITCKKTAECDMGGIEPGTVESDMKFEFSSGVLTIGTIADNYWGGNCTTYDRVTTFNIKNKDKIVEFNLFQVGFDDYMQISLNDHIVYIGPDGGTSLEVIETTEKDWRGRKLKKNVVSNGAKQYPCERSTNWNIGTNIDLRPFLKDGENIIKTRVIVAGAGEGWLKIRAKQTCCKDWDIKREEKCDFF